jgi:hypothetical protein
VTGVNGGLLRNGIGRLPAATVVRVADVVLAVLQLESRDDLDVKAVEPDHDNLAIAANTGPGKTVEGFEAEVRDLMERLDECRKASVTPPERCFRKAQRKIDAGHYDFAVDSTSKAGAPT